MKFRTFALTIAALGFIASPALAMKHMAQAVKTNKSLNILTNAKDMTLYTFDNDKSGSSNCIGGCAKSWPPLMATAKSKSAGGFSVIKRADGTPQWAHNGKALYLWVGDKKAGDMTGDGVGGVWHTAKPYNR